MLSYVEQFPICEKVPKLREQDCNRHVMMTGYTCPTKRIVDLLEETWLWGLGAHTQADVGPDAALEEGGGRKNLWNWFCVQSAAKQELRVW